MEADRNIILVSERQRDAATGRRKLWIQVFCRECGQGTERLLSPQDAQPIPLITDDGELVLGADGDPMGVAEFRALREAAAP